MPRAWQASSKTAWNSEPAVHLDGADGEGHAGHEPVEEARGGGGCSAGAGFQHVPAGDDVAGGEVFEHHAGHGAHV